MVGGTTKWLIINTIYSYETEKGLFIFLSLFFISKGLFFVILLIAFVIKLINAVSES